MISDWSPPAEQLTLEARAYSEMLSSTERRVEELLSRVRAVNPRHSRSCIIANMVPYIYHYVVSKHDEANYRTLISHRRDPQLYNDGYYDEQYSDELCFFSSLWSGGCLFDHLREKHDLITAFGLYFMVCQAALPLAVAGLDDDPSFVDNLPSGDLPKALASFRSEDLLRYGQSDLQRDLRTIRPWNSNRLDYRYLLEGCYNEYSFFRYTLARVLTTKSRAKSAYA